MTKKIICSTSMHSVGCTFLDWSILFLNGKHNFYKPFKGLELLSPDPVTALNAHGHKKNHPSGLNETQQYIEEFLKSPQDLLTLYPFPMRHIVASEKLNIPEQQLSEPGINQSVDKLRADDFSKLFDFLIDNGAAVIYVDHKLPLYNVENRSLDRLFRDSIPAASVKENDNKVQTIFFSNSINQWSDLGLNNTWDQRERLALDTRPFLTIVQPKLDFSKPHCFLDSQEWLSNGTTTIKKVMDFCNLQIDNSRWDQWIAVYNKWQQLHQANLNFCHQLPHIVEAIVNNWYYNIDLTFKQEVVVLHSLIYHHNLNLKSWQLEKFPNNTQDLHKLLEANIHSLGDVSRDIY